MPVQSHQVCPGCVSAGVSHLGASHPAVAFVVAAADAIVAARLGPDVNLRLCGRCRSFQSNSNISRTSGAYCRWRARGSCRQPRLS